MQVKFVELQAPEGSVSLRWEDNYHFQGSEKPGIIDFTVTEILAKEPNWDKFLRELKSTPMQYDKRSLLLFFMTVRVHLHSLNLKLDHFENASLSSALFFAYRNLYLHV